MNIGCYHEDAEGDFHQMTQINHATDGTLVATYEDDTRIGIGAPGASEALLRYDLNDEPYIDTMPQRNAPFTADTAIIAAFHAWMSTEIGTVDADGQVIELADEGTTLGIDPGNGQIIGALWHDERLMGLGHGIGTPLFDMQGNPDTAEIARVQDRLDIIRARVAGEWAIVEGEGDRLGTDTTPLTPGWMVKIGFAPRHPMPDETSHAEWMWVEVIGINGDQITGLLRNTPCALPIDVAFGDTVSFQRHNIYALEQAAKAA